jgi:predicted XRE-type DNA-binding protein
MPARRPLNERLREKLLSQPSGCIEFTGAKDAAGYGVIGSGLPDPVTLKTHRAAWELKHGPIPEGMWVLHHCDNPPCCNVDHLYLGTVKENARDREVRERIGTTTLTARLVREIRKVYARGWFSQTAIAEACGISQAQVSNIVRGRTWKNT